MISTETKIVKSVLFGQKTNGGCGSSPIKSYVRHILIHHAHLKLFSHYTRAVVFFYIIFLCVCQSEQNDEYRVKIFKAQSFPIGENLADSLRLMNQSGYFTLSGLLEKASKIKNTSNSLLQ